MADDFGSDTGTLGVIAAGSFVNGSIETGDDWDWFAVHLVSGQSYQIDLEGASSSKGTLADPLLYVLDETGQFTLNNAQTDDDAGDGLNARTIFAASTTGDFFLAATAIDAKMTGTYRLSVKEVTPPHLLSSSDGQIDLSLSPTLTLTFDEAIKAGTGSILVKRASDNAVVRTIGVTDSAQVSITGSTLTISPASPLADATAYYVTMAAGVVRDLAGNAFAGITLPTTLNFATKDFAPVLVKTTPADGQIGVAAGANVVLTFNETVKAGGGSFEIHDAADDSLVWSAPATATPLTTGQVTFSGATVTLNPNKDLVAGHSYYVLADTAAVLDKGGNTFAGIADMSALNFTVIDKTAPLLLASAPSDNAAKVAVGSDIALTFSENVVAGTGNIEIRGADGSVRRIAAGDASQVTFSGATVTINPTADLAEGMGYSVMMAPGVIRDATGFAFGGIADTTKLNFTTEDTHAPLLVKAVPGDGAVGVVKTANIVLTFNEAVKRGVGNITLHRAADDSVVQSFNVATSTAVTFGAGNTVTINPGDFVPGAGYYVKVDGGAILDKFDNAFAGLPAATDLNFIVADGKAPTLVGSDPAFNAVARPTGVAVDKSLSLTFSETMIAGSGNIEIRRVADNKLVQSIAVGDTKQVTFSGATVTIDPASDLAQGTDYYVKLAPGVLKDASGMSFAGLTAATGLTALDFQTADTHGPLLVSTAPADDAKSVAASANLALNFSETVVRGAGNITIASADGLDVRTISVKDTTQVVVAGGAVTINPLKDLSTAGKEYSVTIDKGAFEDKFGNDFAGIADATTFSFTTKDTVGPTLLYATPADGDLGVAVDADIAMTFSEDVIAGAGTISIYKSNGVLQETIAASSDRVTINGSVVTIDPVADLSSGQDYYIRVSSTAFKDASGNAFAGIASNTALNFTTAGLAGGDDYAGDVTTTGTVAVGGTATGNIEVFSDYDWFKVYLQGGTTYDITEVSVGRTGGVNDPYIWGVYDANGALMPNSWNDDDPTGTGLDSRVTFTPGNSGYYFIEAGSFDTNAGTYQIGVTVQGVAPTDTTAPTLVSTSPADGKTGINPISNLTLTFSEAVKAGTGDIVISSAGDTRTINIADTSQVTFNGASLTINPTADLALDKDYSVTLASGVVTDAAGNPYAGLAAGAMDFHTAAAQSSADAWTILVYIAGDNNLEEFGGLDINEMEQVNLPQNVNVVVLYDRIGGYDSSNGNWTDTRRGAISYDGFDAAIGSTLTSVGEKDMGQTATLTDFIDWGVANYAAQNYGLVVWDHGGGLDGIAWDDTNNDHLSMTEMRTAIANSNVGTFGFIGFDACLMGMTEQVFDLKNEASVIIGSEELIPGEGWAYDRWLGQLAADSSMTASEVATAIVQTYGQEYAGQLDITLSATDTSKLGALEVSLDAFVATALDANVTKSADWTALRTAAGAAHLFPSDDASYRYHDLGDFMGNIAANTAINASLRTAAGNVSTALGVAIIAESGTVADATGLSIYLPYGSQSVRSDYTAANFSFLGAGDGHVAWNSFLAQL